MVVVVGVGLVVQGFSPCGMDAKSLYSGRGPCASINALTIINVASCSDCGVCTVAVALFAEAVKEMGMSGSSEAILEAKGFCIGGRTGYGASDGIS